MADAHARLREAVARRLLLRTRPGYERDAVWDAAWKRFNSPRRRSTYHDDIAIKHAAEDADALLALIAASEDARELAVRNMLDFVSDKHGWLSDADARDLAASAFGSLRTDG